MLKRIAIVILALLAARAAAAQANPGPQVNAALRYWMAFAMMKDIPDAQLDDATVKSMEDVLAGKTGWDEKRLGPLLEANLAAIQAMQRATHLTQCDWQLEYELGPSTPLYHLPRARVLARLNALYGLRALAQHEPAAAVQSWVAGLAFSRHMAQGSSLMGTLTAKAALLSDLRIIAANADALDESSSAKLRRAVQALPEYGFDWPEAMRREANADVQALTEISRSQDPRKLYRDWFGEPMPATVTVPTAADIAAWRALMSRQAQAFHLPYPAAQEKLALIGNELAHLNGVAQRITPSLSRTNDAREEIARARDAALQALSRR
jgi:hypothetical protein